jgi:RNA polymerase sigma-70 factor (ECF subfamily)
MIEVTAQEQAVSDEALLILFANGDRAATRVLTERMTPRAYRLALRLLGDRAEAEDVAQEAMVKLWKIAPDWRRGEAKPSTWLFTVTRNLCLDRLRRGAGRTAPLEAAGEIEDTAPSALRMLTEAERAEALQAALGDLPLRQREAVVLRHLEGLSNPEIAGIMDISVEAVESLTARAKRMLAEALAHRREELGFAE